MRIRIGKNGAVWAWPALCVAILCGSCGRGGPEEKLANKVHLSREQVRMLRRNSGINPATLTIMDKSELSALVLESRHPAIPRSREEFWALLHRNESGAIPPGGQFQAFLEKAQLQASLPKARLAIAGIPIRTPLKVPATAGLYPAGWTELGPAGVGGRTRAIALDPSNPDVIWVGSVGGGVWRSTNGGETFDPADDLMANLVVSTIVVDPTNPNIVYAGTGEGFPNLDDGLRGAGVFVLTIDPNRKIKGSQLVGTAGPNFQWVNRLAISPDGKVLIAATRQGLQVSSDPGRTDWNLRLAANVADVKFHPTDSKQLVAGGLNTGEAYYSEDGGLTWKTASHGPDKWIHVWVDQPNSPGREEPGRVELAYAKAKPNIVYASVDNNSGEIWRSTDGGKSYSKMDSVLSDGSWLTANYLGGQGWYGNAIWAGDPSNADFVIVGGVNLWKSNDGGKTLVDISNSEQDKSAHPDHHAIVAHSQYNGSSNKKVYFGNDGGVYMASDISTVGSDRARVNGWTKLNGKYSVTQFYGIAVGPDGTVVGGAQDNGTLELAAGAKPDGWVEIFGGDGGFCAADPTANVLYGEYTYGNVHRRSAPGKVAEYISGQYWDGEDWRWKAPPYQIPDTRTGAANFIAPFALDPNNPNRILVGGASLWETRDAKTPNALDRGPSWRPIKDPTGQYISAIAIAKDDPNRIWVGANDGAVYATLDGLAPIPRWARIGAATLPGRMVTHISIDSKDRNVVYVSYGGYSAGNIWKTKDGGVHWSGAASALPKAPVFTITVHPKNSKYVYAGTEVGVFASEDGGAHWSPGNERQINCAVFDLQWSGNTLFAATHGRGTFKINLGAVPGS